VSTVEQRTGVAGDRWLMLVHQLPAKPAYLRVKIWRRLQGLGAVAVKNSVYALPFSGETQEDLEWLLREIQEGGGEAMVLEARLVDGMADGEVRALFDRARDGDYGEIAKDARELAKSLGRKPSREARRDVKAQLAKLRARFVQVHGIDFFGANGREVVHGLLSGLEERLVDPAETQDRTEMGNATTDRAELKDRTWVTRAGVHVDRIGSAWLIRRFIDPHARFKFVPPKGYVPEAGELRFDMFEAEFTHEGDRCTFEVLVARAGLGNDRALTAISQIVHDIDLKDTKFARPEAEGIKSLIAGICNSAQDDEERLARGATVFEDLYRSFAKRRSRRA
jgi:hypothetical protein